MDSTQSPLGFDVPTATRHLSHRSDAGYDPRVPDTAQLTDRQAQRRSRVIEAALELAAEGGYEGVQMRAVASRADVALGTVYHYFTSKDHLLAASMIELMKGLEKSAAKVPAVGVTNLQRVLDLLHRITDSMADNQNVSSALIGGLVAEGAEVAVCQVQMHATFDSVLATAFEPDFPADDRRRMIRALEHVWFSALIGWKNGWMTFEQAVDDLEDAAAMLWSGRE